MNNVRQKHIPGQNLVECVICGRRFVEGRIKVHESICQKSFNSTRKAFDTSRQRISGTGAEKFAKAAAAKECSFETQPNKSVRLLTNWRKKHQELQNNIKAAKELLNEGSPKVNDLPFPPPTTYDGDYVQCQHCLRQYNKTSAARHIAACARRMCESKSKRNSPTHSGPNISEVNVTNES